LVEALQNGQVKGSVITKGDRTHVISRLPVGNYTVKASKIGYGTHTTRTIEVIAGETTVVNLVLIPYQPGWPKVIGEGFAAHPNLCDIDKNGKLEIVIPSEWPDN
jgi:hypothetical protein